jgi:hemerythrin
METIKWTPAISVGVTEIDEQHQKLFAIIDELGKAQAAVPDKGAVLAILTQLVDYSDYHFRTEDDFMIENSYPLFLSHRKEHLAYIKKMGTLIDDLENKGAALPGDILNFLCDWWQTHISQSDMKYARYIKSQKGA